MDSNKLFIIAFIVSAALLLVPVLIRFGKKPAAAVFADTEPRREPGSPSSAIYAAKIASSNAVAPPGVRVAHGKQTPLETFIACLEEAIESHYHDWVEPLVAAAEGTVFILHSITVEITATNLPLLEPASSLKPALLKRVFEDRLSRSAGHAHYDKSRFYGIAFRNGSEAKPTNGDVIRVLKAHGGERMEITLIFHGEPDYRAPRQTQLRDADSDIDDGGQRGIAATLIVTLPGEAERTVSVRKTPFRIGADDTADLPVDSPYLSRTHAVLDACTGGGLTITDKSRNGTWLNGVKLTADIPVRLGTRGLILLSSAKPGDDVPLIEYRCNTSETRNSGTVQNAGSIVGSAEIVTQIDGPAPHTANAAVAEVSTATVIDGEAPIVIPKPVQHKAVLRIITGDGDETEHPLDELGIEIGREPAEKGITAPASAKRVSRRHLHLTEWAHGNGAFVENLAVDRGGTYLDGQRQDAQFIWRFADTKKRPDEGWLTLGSPREGYDVIRMRLERVETRQGV